MATDKNNKAFSHMRLSEKIALAVTVVAVFVGLGMDLSDQPIYESLRGWLLALVGCVALYALVPSILRCANNGVKSVWSVCGASLLVLGIALTVFYVSYYWIVSASPSETLISGTDKVLNFPPVMAALWAAGMGWYIHFQASAKNHRTTNSFNLLMQTRTSKEFIEHARLVQKFYPFGTTVPDSEAEFFSTSKLKELYAQERERKAANADCSDLEVLIEKVKAADALKYLLNFYEFMSVGVDAKDLDDDLLFNTISVTVCSMYRRAEPCVLFIRRGQPLAFIKLEALVTRWEARLHDEVHARGARGAHPGAGA